MSRLFWTALVALFLAISFVTLTGGEGDGEDLDAVHHVADGNYLDFMPFGKVELPRILMVRCGVRSLRGRTRGGGESRDR